MVWKNQYTLCLYTFDDNDQLNELVCDLSISDMKNDKCSVVVDPYSPNVLYANIINEGISTSYISFDNGKRFIPIELENQRSKCFQINCIIELDLVCSNDLIQNHFPEKSVVIFQEKSKCKKSKDCQHMFISFNGGKIWKMVNYDFENIKIINGGSLMVAAEKSTGKFWYSYTMGTKWYKIGWWWWYRIIDIEPLESANNQIIATINYHELTGVPSIFIYDFTKALGNYV
ncbi:hypothetical protein RF11_00434 [Thelohanellus kitauei]|uniref:Sortilin N-terminal domain-containing protein n=1 Tax=Thelohanellus kitauei TaxID=669202 RepID=A0A0C2MF53_THEKT|nr:hypothetical protein RF11_00434 [Thelohanellus kitauei]